MESLLSEHAPKSARIPNGNASVRFYTKQFKDERLSKEAGFDQFSDRLFVEITIPGLRDVIDTFAEPEHKEKYAREYDQFLRSEGGVRSGKEGTPLFEVAWLPRTRAAAFAVGHVDTLEELAALSFERAGQFGPGTKQDIERAKATLAAQKDAGHTLKLATEVETLKEQLKAKDDEIKEIKESLRLAESKKK